MKKGGTVFRIVEFDPRDIGNFLDMLRYDRATIESWGYGRTGRGIPPTARLRDFAPTPFWVRIRSDPSRTPGLEFTIARWESFGLTLKEDA